METKVMPVLRIVGTVITRLIGAGKIALPLPVLLVAAIMGSAGVAYADDEGEGVADSVELETVQEEWAEAVEALKGYSVNQREVAVEKAGEVLEDMDERIEVLQEKTVDEWESLSAETREARLEALRALVKQREELAEWYGGMKHSSAQAWGEVREGFIGAYGVLQDAWVDAAEEFE
jgi:flagellar motility protein MotE (MotC chaperone)